MTPDVLSASGSETTAANPYDLRYFSQFAASHPEVLFVLVQWLDHLAILRSRWLPIDSFRSMITAGSRIGISKGNLGTLQNDHLSPVCDPVGQILVEPDLASLKLMHGEEDGTMRKTCPASGTVMARFRDDKAQALDLCPRSQLEGFVSALDKEYQINLLVGFEIEVTFCRRCDTLAGVETQNIYEPLDEDHAWGTLTDEQYYTAFPLMTTIATALLKIGIEVQQVHSEAGRGQYEFVLPPLPPVPAVDTLIQARQCIQQIAATRGLRATCHPMPFPGIGTAAHAHVSLNSPSLSVQRLKELEMSFAASVLSHLPALCAFTMPQAVSYGRVVDDSWTGGTWVAWGTQNREVPLRRVGAVHDGSGSRWEIRCLDGMANMYLALGAILGAGLAGLRSGVEMRMEDCASESRQLRYVNARSD